MSSSSPSDKECNDKSLKRTKYPVEDESSYSEIRKRKGSTSQPSSRRRKSYRSTEMSRSRSRSRHSSPSCNRSRSPRHRERKLSRDEERSPRDDREKPDVCHCLGVFGLSSYTEEKHLKEVFTQYGPVDDIFIIYDRQTGRSKGFGFVYFKSTEDAMEARKACQGLKLDGRFIRVDYSLTTHPHAPTPGRYLGKSHNFHMRYDRRDDYREYEYSSRSHHSRYREPRDDYYDREDYRDYSDYYRRRPSRFSPYSRHY